jgi:hypothetical protein
MNAEQRRAASFRRQLFHSPENIKAVGDVNCWEIIFISSSRIFWRRPLARSLSVPSIAALGCVRKIYRAAHGSLSLT